MSLSLSRPHPRGSLGTPSCCLPPSPLPSQGRGNLLGNHHTATNRVFKKKNSTKKPTTELNRFCVYIFNNRKDAFEQSLMMPHALAPVPLCCWPVGMVPHPHGVQEKEWGAPARGCSNAPGQQHPLFGVGSGRQGHGAGRCVPALERTLNQLLAELAQVTLALYPHVSSAEQMVRPLDAIQHHSTALR